MHTLYSRALAPALATLLTAGGTGVSAQGERSPWAAVASPAPAEARQHTLADMLRAAFDQAPSLRSSDAQIAAARAGVITASARPNPELGLTVENAFGTGVYRALRGAETTLEIGQPIELGGKRRARIESARAGQTLAENALAVARLDLVRSVTRAYAELCAADARTTLAAERVAVAQEVLRAVQAKVDAGFEPPIQARKAQAELGTARSAVDRARADLLSARYALAAFSGDAGTAAVADPAWFASLAVTSSLVTDEALAEAPGLQVFRLAREAARARVRQARTERAPDVRVSIGVRRLEESHDVAAVGNVTIPLGLFNRNQGAVAQASAEADRAAADAEVGRRELIAQVRRGEQDLIASASEADRVVRETLPAAEEALRLARLGYERGKFGYLDVIDAERSVLTVREALIAARLRGRTARADLDRQLGRPPPELAGGSMVR